MLLEPRSSAEELCEGLSINVDNLESRRIYICPSKDCVIKRRNKFSSVAGVRCSCGKTINKLNGKKMEKVRNAVFLKGESTFMITNDMHVFPATLSGKVAYLQNLGIDNVNTLEKRVADVNRDVMLSLLKMLLTSKTPLTDVFLKKRESCKAKEENKINEQSKIKLEKDTEVVKQEKVMCLKLLLDKDKKEVLYAEAGNDINDNIFSFLYFPLGSIIKILNRQSAVGCADNLYNSVVSLASSVDCFLTGSCNDKLLSPLLYPHYKFKSQVLKTESGVPRIYYVYECKLCWDKGTSNCEHGYTKTVLLTQSDPKKDIYSESGEGYVKDISS